MASIGNILERHGGVLGWTARYEYLTSKHILGESSQLVRGLLFMVFFKSPSWRFFRCCMAYKCELLLTPNGCYKWDDPPSSHGGLILATPPSSIQIKHVFQAILESKDLGGWEVFFSKEVPN